MCAGCRRKEDRSTLLRIGVDKDGSLGNWPGEGRSAYVHSREDCILRLTSKGLLDKALRAKVEVWRREKLREELLCQLR